MTENNGKKIKRYSALGKLALIGCPLLVYVGAAFMSIDVRESLNANSAVDITVVSTAVGLFVLRFVTISACVLATLVTFLGTPKENMPKWMVKNENHP